MSRVGAGLDKIYFCGRVWAQDRILRERSEKSVQRRSLIPTLQGQSGASDSQPAQLV